MPNRHWTAESDGAFVHKLGFDFVAQVEKRMKDVGLTQVKLANTLGVSEGAVSKTLNNPQNLTLKTIAKYSRALGIKAAIVGYDDGDPTNENGLIASEIFSTCWEKAGRPRDMWSLPQTAATTAGLAVNVFWNPWAARDFHRYVVWSGNNSNETIPFDNFIYWRSEPCLK